MGLQTLWFILWGLLWAVYFMLDGFDLGSGILRNFLAKDDTERTLILHSIGPVWDGNEVWLITAGGATFAAFPATYASMFSFLYIPMLIILFSLIGRGVAVEFRGKDESQSWRNLWDWVMMVCSLLAAFTFGLVFGNVFRGLPIGANGYEGTFGGLLNYYGLLTGLLFVVVFLLHGFLWVAVKVEGDLAVRARKAAGTTWYVLLIVAVGFLVATAFATKLYNNFLAFPLWFLVPLIAVVSLLGVKLFLLRGKELRAFFASCAVIVFVVFTGIIGLFPSLIPSTLDPAYSLTAYNSSSSHYTLTVMTIVAVIFVPIVIVYQIFVYRLYRKRISGADLAGETELY